MMAGSHVVLGAVAWVVVAPRFGLPALEPLPLGLAVAGSLLPDIDHPQSWVGRRVRPLSTMIATVLGHRGATHSLLAVAGCGWLLFHGGYSRAIVVPLLIGYLSHLLGDLLTPRGLRLSWPLKGTWALPLCKSGSPSEPLVLLALIAAAWCWVATPQTRQAVAAATGICTWAPAGLLPPGFLPAICPPPPRPVSATVRKRSAVVAANRSGPRG